MFQIISCKRLLEVGSEIVARFHREIQNLAWEKYYRLINFKNNQIQKKSSTILIVEEIEAWRGYK